MRIVIFFFIGLSVGLLVSCKPQKPQSQVPIYTKEKVVERLVPYALPPDSASIRALFSCDSLNNVIMNGFAEQKTNRFNSRFSFDNGVFKYNLNTPPDTIYVPAKDSIIYKEVPVEVVREIPIYKQTTMQIVCGWFGKLFMGIIGICVLGGGIYIGLKLLKWKLRL